MTIEDYCKYLQSKRFVTEKQIPFYARWVTQYLQFCNSQTEQSTPAQKVDDFLRKIAKRYEQWQIVQAKEAISLNQFFLSHRWLKRVGIEILIG